MGQPVTFLRSSSPRPGIVRFELNRSVTGMGHEYYNTADDILGDRGVDDLARRLLETNKITSLHIYGSMVTAHLTSSDTTLDELNIAFNDAIGGLYTYYVEGVEVPSDEELMSQVS